MTTVPPVCAVVGVGPGNGSALARRFAAQGHAVALLARSTDTTEALAASLPRARAYACNVIDAVAITSTFAAIHEELGPVQTLLYNAGPGTWGTPEATTALQMEQAWRINAVLEAAAQCSRLLLNAPTSCSRSFEESARAARRTSWVADVTAIHRATRWAEIPLGEPRRFLRRREPRAFVLPVSAPLPR